MKLSLVQAIRLFLIVTLSISGTAWTIYGGYYLFWQQKLKNPQYQILALVQASFEGEGLKNSFLMELLNLSIDSPKNLYSYNLKEGEKLLKNFPLIESAKIKRIPPGTLFVEYSLRKPILFLKDYTNTALDLEGILIPFSPFFSPKQLPELKIDTSNEIFYRWGDKISSEVWQQYNKIQATLVELQLPYRLLSIDLSKVKSASRGDRRLTLEFEMFTTISHQVTIYLDPENYIKSLKMIRGIEKIINSQNHKIILDLRIPQIAYIQPT